jgi:hypothetical protein
MHRTMCSLGFHIDDGPAVRYIRFPKHCVCFHAASALTFKHSRLGVGASTPSGKNADTGQLSRQLKEAGRVDLTLSCVQCFSKMLHYFSDHLYLTRSVQFLLLCKELSDNNLQGQKKHELNLAMTSQAPIKQLKILGKARIHLNRQ